MSDLTDKLKTIAIECDDEDIELIIALVREHDSPRLIGMDFASDFLEEVRADERARFKAEVVEVVKNCAAFNSRDRDYAKQELIKDIEGL